MRQKIALCIALLLALCPAALPAAEIRTRVALPAAEELYCLHFDPRGLLWMGTSAGVKSYDGYAVREEFADAVRQFPQLGSDVRCLATDSAGNLWAGTNDGLLRIALGTGRARLFRFPKSSQQIVYALFCGRDGTVYAGTDDGFSLCRRGEDRFLHFNVETATALWPDGRRGRYEGWGVKDFAETPGGEILVGTWGQGLWRYSPGRRELYAYARLNWMNSAFALCPDRQGRLWIGTQGCGVQCVDRWDDCLLASLRTVGLGPLAGPGAVVNDVVQTPDGQVRACTGDTVAACTGPDGALWMGTRGGGIVRIRQAGDLFTNYSLGAHVCCIYTEDGRHFYLGLGTQGLARYDAATGRLEKNRRVPGYEALPDGELATRVTSILRRSNGELWMAAGDNGLWVSRPDGTSEVLYPHTRQLPYVKDNVLALYESPHDRALWMGGRQGISVLLPDGRGVALDVKTDSVDLTGYVMVNHIAGDRAGRIWVSTANRGIIRIEGDPAFPQRLRLRRYGPSSAAVTACYEDSRRCLWALSSSGLLRYNAEIDRFCPVGRPGLLEGRKVQALCEDRHGALWLATDRALLRLGADSSLVSFTAQDGLASASFVPNAVFRLGDSLYFGTAEGFVAFDPEGAYGGLRRFVPNLVVTDFLLDGTSYFALDSSARSALAAERPMLAREITVPASARSFGVEFSLLTYADQAETRYACLLEGYDEEWRAVDGAVRRAVYERVPPGDYRFRLRALDSRGEWHGLPYAIGVRVLAPWYASGWAYLIYIVLLFLFGRFVWSYLRMRREMRASRRFSAILQSAQLSPASGVGAEPAPEAGRGRAETAGQQRDAEFVARATRLVRDHLDDSAYNRDRMAADLGMSVSTLYSRLRECTDLSIQTFIQAVRLNAACDILRAEPGIRISELAYRVGFNTPKYFSQCFKKEFGLLPGEFARRQGGGADMR